MIIIWYYLLNLNVLHIFTYLNIIAVSKNYISIDAYKLQYLTYVF